MEKKLPTVENVMAALPAVQAAVKREIAARIAAGEDIAGMDLQKRAAARGTSRTAPRGRAARHKSAA